MLNSKAKTDIVTAAESRYQQSLARKQEKLAAKNRHKATTTQPPSHTVLWAVQLERTLVETLAACMAQPEQLELREALVRALPSAVRHLESVVLSDAPVVDRTKAANTLAWLFSVCTRTQVRLNRVEAQKEVAISRRARANAIKAAADRDVAVIDIETKKAKAKAKKVLQAAKVELGVAPDGFELPADVDPKSKLARLLLKQHDARE